MQMGYQIYSCPYSMQCSHTQHRVFINELNNAIEEENPPKKGAQETIKSRVRVRVIWCPLHENTFNLFGVKHCLVILFLHRATSSHSPNIDCNNTCSLTPCCIAL